MGASCSHVVALSRASDRHESMFAEEMVDLFSTDRPANDEVKYLLLKDKKISTKKEFHIRVRLGC